MILNEQYFVCDIIFSVRLPWKLSFCLKWLQNLKLDTLPKLLLLPNQLPLLYVTLLLLLTILKVWGCLQHSSRNQEVKPQKWPKHNFFTLKTVNSCYLEYSSSRTFALPRKIYPVSLSFRTWPKQKSSRYLESRYLKFRTNFSLVISNFLQFFFSNWNFLIPYGTIAAAVPTRMSKDYHKSNFLFFRFDLIFWSLDYSMKVLFKDHWKWWRLWTKTFHYY